MTTAEACVAQQAKDPTSIGLCPEQIRTVVLGVMGSFQNCFEIALKEDRSAQGGISIAATVSPQGKVDRAIVSSSSLELPYVEKCMVDVFLGLSFPTAGKPTNFAFPFVFKGR